MALSEYLPVLAFTISLNTCLDIKPCVNREMDFVISFDSGLNVPLFPVADLIWLGSNATISHFLHHPNITPSYPSSLRYFEKSLAKPLFFHLLYIYLPPKLSPSFIV